LIITASLASHPCLLRASLSPSSSFLLVLRRAPTSTLFPYTTLFRSRPPGAPALERGLVDLVALGDVVGLVIGLGSQTKPKTGERDRKSTRLNSSHGSISYAVFCLKKKKYKTKDN